MTIFLSNIVGPLHNGHVISSFMLMDQLVVRGCVQLVAEVGGWQAEAVAVEVVIVATEW